MWSKLSIGHCLLQRWWLAVTQPNGQSWKKRPEILKRASQLICSIPAGQEKDKITAVYSWSSRIKHNYFKHSATFSVGCAGAGQRALCWCCKALGALAPWCTKTLHLRLVGTDLSEQGTLPFFINPVLLDLVCTSVPMLFCFSSGIFLSVLPFPCSLFCVRVLVALRWRAFYVHTSLAFPYHMVILMLPFASIILFVAAWTS